MRLSLSLALILVSLPACAQTQMSPMPMPQGNYGQGHERFHESFYKDLKAPDTGYSCCNGDEKHGDCRPTRAYKQEDGTWRALLNGRWITVPSAKVLNIIAPDGGSHICAAPSGLIYCFIGGEPKS